MMFERLSHRRWRPQRVLLALSLGLVAGCGLPTWSELIGAKKEEPAPLVVPVQPVPRVAPTVTPEPPPPPPDPAQVIADFQAKPSQALDDHALRSLFELESGLEEIKVLNLNGSQVSNHGLKGLGKLTQLAKLDIRNSLIDERAANAIAEATSIEELRLDGSDLTDESLAALRPLQSLRVLEVNQVRLSPRGWAEMFHHPELEELRIVQSNINDEGLLALSRCAKLRRIQMNDVGISDLGLAQLGRLDALEHLNVSGCGVTGAGFRGVGGGRGAFLALNELSMQACPLNEQGAAVISQMKHLRYLNFGNMPTMRDIDFMRMIKPLKELEYLHSPGNISLTGQALSAFAGQENIQTISLSGCSGIDDSGLRHLVKCTNLKRIDLTGTRCSQRGVIALKSALPELQIDGL